MNRIVEPELLDELPADDPRAILSRRDIRRMNGWMGNARTIARALKRTLADRAPHHVTELGAGDGELMLRVARLVPNGSSQITPSAVLLDQQNLTREETAKRFASVGWKTRFVTDDVFHHLRNGFEPTEVTIANLFLHHFKNEPLRELLSLASRRTQRFIAVEPRRARLPLFFSRMVWLIGCNAVTRNDAVISVRAGFRGRELSALWPNHQAWDLVERRAGLFSHFFMAQRKR